MVGQVITSFRLEKGLSQSELAVRAGVDKSYLQSIERQVILYPSLETLEKLSLALDISVETILREISLDTFDPDWDKIVLEALKAGVPTNEYLAFLETSSSNVDKRITI